jgi:hypothetical protein
LNNFNGDKSPLKVLWVLKKKNRALVLPILLLQLLSSQDLKKKAITLILKWLYFITVAESSTKGCNGKEKWFFFALSNCIV